MGLGQRPHYDVGVVVVEHAVARHPDPGRRAERQVRRHPGELHAEGGGWHAGGVGLANRAEQRGDAQDHRRQRAARAP